MAHGCEHRERRVFPEGSTALRRLSVEALQVLMDQPPRREPVLAPRIGRDEAIVGAAANAVDDPFFERVGVGKRPPAVDLEPGVGAAQRFFRTGSRHVVRSRNRRASIAASE